MSTRKWIFFISYAMLTIVVSTVSFYLYKQYRMTHFSCAGEYTAIHNDTSFSSRNSLTLNGSDGIWIMDGKISYPDKKASYFKLRNNFKVKREGSAYQFFSEHVTVVPLNNTRINSLDTFVNDAILHEKKSTFYSLYPINNALIIYSGDMPVMYCMKK
ncbi:hypothetical protein ACMYSK_23115 [Klebsiella sp. I138]|uniref:hypothetical protein n=1 Tax=Klebsiella sp. I138 TaxID=2755385 RepID=UPI003DA7DF88